MNDQKEHSEFMARLVKCRVCGEKLPRYAMFAHRKAAHGLVKKSRHIQAATPSLTPDVPTPTLDRYRALVREQNALVRELENERDQVAAKLIEYDNIINSFKKL